MQLANVALAHREVYQALVPLILIHAIVRCIKIICQITYHYVTLSIVLDFVYLNTQI